MNLVNIQKLSLVQPAVYQIKVPGHLDESWFQWIAGITVKVDSDEHGLPLTTLTGGMDQAALLGLLRHLYSLGVPLISVNCLEVK